MEQSLALDKLVFNKSVACKKYWDSKLSGYEHNQYFNDFRGAKHEGGRAWHVIEKTAAPDLHKDLEEISSVHDGKHSILLSALGVLAQKVSSIKDVCIFTLVYAHLRNGSHVNYFVPVRMNDYSIDFSQFSANVKDGFLEGLNHVNYPLESIFANQAVDFKELSKVVMILEDFQTIDEDHMDFDILFSFKASSELTLKIKYDVRQFSDTYVNQIIDLYFDLLKRLLHVKDQPLENIALISAAERHKILDEFNNTDRPFAGDKTIVDLFKEQSNKFSNRTAVRFKGASLTYRQLDEKSNQVADYLLKKGIQTGDVVAVMLERSMELPIAIFGILKAGCIYMPISKDHPDDRIAYSLRDSSCKMLFAKKDDVERFQNEFICKDITELKDSDASINIQYASPEQPAYLIYTSGSTGKPKGVLVKHRSLVNRLIWEQNKYPINEHDVILQKTPIVFDVSMFELFWWSLTGATMVLAEPGMERSPKELSALIEDENVTIMHFVPSMLRVFLEWLVSEKSDKPLNCIKHVFTSGEELSVGDAKKLLSLCPHVDLHNLYGPTEATVEVSYFDVKKDYSHNRIPIGKPIDNTQLLIFNDHMQLLPISIAGELYIGGENLAIGYLNQPELTQEKFIDHPLETGKKLYRTGDLARWMTDGNIEFLGRIDNQVKIRGNRVELEEIEHVIAKHKGVKQVVVLAKSASSGHQLAAFVIHDDTVLEEEIQAYLTSQLPAYMIPSYFIKVDQIPITINGKADRKKLLQKLDDQSHRQYTAPSSGLEMQLCEIWSQVLEKDKVGVEDKFFTTGGDSILAVRLLGMINDAFKIALSSRNLYEYDTIRALAGFMSSNQLEYDETLHNNVREQVDNFGKDYLTRYPDDAIEDVYPMSDIENGMCFVSIQNPSEILYVEQNFHPLSYRDFQFDIFQKAAWLLAQKHPALRTAYDLNNFAHIVYKDPALNISYQDLSGILRKDQKNIIESSARKVLITNLNFTEAPLWRIDIYRLGPNNLLMVFTGHHAILDGWSYASFINELNDVYNQLLISADFKPSILKATYRDYIILERAQKKNIETKSFWQNELSGYKRVNFGIKSTTKTFRVVNKEYPATYSHNLNLVAKQTHIPAKHLLFAAYLYALKMLTYEDDLVVGMVCFKRPLTKDGDKVLGCFLNTVPVRIKISSDTTWHSFIHMVDQKLSEVRKYDGLSLYEISQAVGESYQGSHPFFDTFFNFINFHIADKFTDAGRHETESLDFEDFTREGTFFNVSMHVNEQGIQARYDYANTFLDENLFTKFLFYYEKFIQELPDHLLGQKPDVEINLLTELERRELLHVFNKRTIPHSEEKSIIELFEEQAITHGDRQAVICNNQYLTYRELNEKSNALANYLIAKGVKPENTIGLYVERSPAMIISLLAILKAGAAYLPLDTEYPMERIHKIIENARPVLIVTDQSVVIHSIISEALTVDLILNEDPIREMPARNPETKYGVLNHAAYILYTSGSTGMPKGVLVEHASLLDYSLTFKEYMSLTQEDRVIQQASLSFDTSVEEIFPALISGALLILVPTKGRNIEKLLAAIQNNQATILSTTPVVLNELNKQPDKLDSLRAIVSGGDLLLPSHVNNLIGKKTLYNSYGPTESTVCIAYQQIRKVEDVFHLGRPLRNRHVYIVDKDHRLQSIGIPGELCVSGAGLAREYVGDANLTNQKFVRNPFEDGSRMYKTGDLAKWNDEGELEFLGRVDAQLKIRGNRIEPGEIEQTILKKENIQQAAVIAKEQNNQKYLIAFLVSDERYSDDELRKFLSERLPEYMIPLYFIWLESMPVTSNHKVDVAALSEYKIKWLNEYMPPTNDVEKELVILWQQILIKEKIGIQDNFFQAGGNSLSVITLKNKIFKAFDVDIPVKEIFDRPTPKLLGEYIGLHAWLQRNPEQQKRKASEMII